MAAQGRRLTGYIVAEEGGLIIPLDISHLGEANSYETEKKLYCPCPQGLAGQRRICFLAKSHQLGEILCENWKEAGDGQTAAS